MATCAFPECGRPTNPRVLSATLCATHYAQRTHGKDLHPIRARRAEVARTTPFCTFAGCGRPTNPHVKSATLCRKHHDMQSRGEDLRPLRVVGPKRVGCDFPGCDRPHCGKGLCKPHLMQQNRGVPLRALGEPRGRSAKPKKPKGAAPTVQVSRMPPGWDRVAPKTKPKKPMAGAKVMMIEGPGETIAPEVAEMARRLLTRHGLDDLADMLGIAADRESESAVAA